MGKIRVLVDFCSRLAKQRIDLGIYKFQYYYLFFLMWAGNNEPVWVTPTTFSEWYRYSIWGTSIDKRQCWFLKLFSLFCVHMYVFMSVSFWTPGGSRKSPIKWGLFSLPSFHPSGINSYKVVHGRAGFSGKNFFCLKIEKKGPKMAKNMVFSIYSKIWSFIFTPFHL